MNLESARELKQRMVRMAVSSMAVRVASSALNARALESVSTIRTMAIGIAGKRKGQYQIAVRIQQRALQSTELVKEIRRKAKNEVDLRYIGRVAKSRLWTRARRRPLCPGISVGHINVTAGTLGCFVTSAGDTLILSNNHVLADENKGSRGDAILQPARSDGGKSPREKIGELDTYIPLYRRKKNFVDAALATIRDTIRFEPCLLRNVGNLAGLRDEELLPGDLVYKIGRTTSYAKGRVTAIDLDNVVVSYDLGSLRFDDQVEIESVEDGPFSQGGDSGSLIFDENNKAVGLLFAGSDQGGSNGLGQTYANPIRRVLSDLGVALLT